MAGPGPKTALIAAADAHHGGLLAELGRSLRDQAPADAWDHMDFCVLDLGLDAAAWSALDGLVDCRAEARWDLDFPNKDKAPGWFRAMTARPHLPDYFPGYDVYVWLDADTWVQDFSAVALLIEAAQRFECALVPEIDRSYGSLYGLGNAGSNAAECNAEAFGAEIGARLSVLPLLNSGVLAISAKSPVWQSWSNTLAQALQKSQHKLVEQAALNLALYQGGLSVHYLPSLCNWVAVLGPPRFDRARGVWVEPYLPFSQIGVMHLTALIDQPLKTFTTEGEPIEVFLRYGQKSTW